MIVNKNQLEKEKHWPVYISFAAKLPALPRKKPLINIIELRATVYHSILQWRLTKLALYFTDGQPEPIIARQRIKIRSIAIFFYAYSQFVININRSSSVFQNFVA